MGPKLLAPGSTRLQTRLKRSSSHRPTKSLRSGTPMQNKRRGRRRKKKKGFRWLTKAPSSSSTRKEGTGMGRPFKGPHPPRQSPGFDERWCSAPWRKRGQNGGRLRRRASRKSHCENACSRRRANTGCLRRAAPSQAHLNATCRWHSETGRLPMAAPRQPTERHPKVVLKVWVPAEGGAQRAPI